MLFRMRHQGSSGRWGGRCRAESPKERPESRRGGGWPRLLAGLAAAALLSGCDDRILDTGFGYGYLAGETVPLSGAESPIRRMSGSDPDYPSLYSVPDRPPPPPGPEERQRQIERLAAAREAARAVDAALKAVAPQPPEPPPVLPPGRR
ncbi:MAG: hypothetical protein WCO00_05920 [Rhodospirillaceae bacterium]